jgi:WD40 repeat protein
LGLVAVALAQDPESKDATDLYDRPVLAIDPSKHTAVIRTQAVDAAGRYAVTGSADRTVRIWSVADGKLLRTIWIPVGPEIVGRVYAVAISPEGSTIAAGGWTERLHGDGPIYLFDRESGSLIRPLRGIPDTVHSLTFSPEGRYLAATLTKGLRIFDRDKDWREAFRDDQYGDISYGSAFARDGRLATTSYDGLIRLYQYNPNSDSPNFRRVGEPVSAPSGHRPDGIAFNPDGKRLAVGYDDVAAVDVLNGATLAREGGQSPSNTAFTATAGLIHVAWSTDGRTLFAAGGVGAVNDAQLRLLLFAWDRGGMGDERRMTYCAPNSAAGVDALSGGRILVASMGTCLGVTDARGEPIWTVASPILDFREQRDVMRVSQDGRVVDFGFRGSAGPVLRYDVRSLTLSRPAAPNESGTFASLREGLTIDGWRNGMKPTLSGRALSLAPYEVSHSLAIAQDAKRFFLGSNFALTAFDEAGRQKWRLRSRATVWAVNASKDGRVVVTAGGDGAIRWHRADDGRELLALQVLPNGKEPPEWDWVLWTPEGFYEATPGAEDVLKWVVNHGPDNAATTLPVSAVAKLHRPSALPLVLTELETARAGLDGWHDRNRTVYSEPVVTSSFSGT